MNRFFLFFIFLCLANALCSQELLYVKSESKNDTFNALIGYFNATTCKDSVICEIKNFSGDDIAICPNGGVYLGGFSVDMDGFYEYKMIRLNLVDCTTTLITNLREGLTSCTCANDGTLYFGAFTIWSYDTNTGILDSIGAPPDLFLSGDLSFYNGQLIGTVYTGAVLAFDLDNIENTTNLFNYDPTLSSLGLVSASQSCDSTTVYFSLTNDRGFPFTGDTINKLYALDIPTQTLTYLCELPRFLIGLCSATEFIAQDCNLVLDLNGTGNTTTDYTVGNWCGIPPAPVCDDDMLLYDGYRIDSVQIQLLPPFSNGNSAYLTHGVIPPFVAASGQNTATLLLRRTNTSVPNESVAANYFIEAIKSIRLNDTAIPVTPGLRTIQTIAFAKNGRTDTAFTYITIPEVVVDIVGDSIICANQAVTLNTGAFSNYLWSTGATTSTISVANSGIYAITVTDINSGCIGEGSYTINEAMPPFADWEVTPPRCHNGPDGSIEIIQTSGGHPPFLFSINGNPSSPLPLFTGLESGVQTIVIADNEGCIWSEDITIPNPDAIVLDIGQDLRLEIGKTEQLLPTLGPTDNYTYQWQPTDYLSCNNCLSPLVTPLTDIRYYLTATNNNGCSANDSIQVRVQIPDGNVYAPNIFTPDNDGKDDYFSVFGDPLLVQEVVKLQIYDRWGALIYEGNNLSSNDTNVGWDGTVKGKSATPGVYVWIANIRFTNGNTVQKQGDITLIR